MPCEQNFNRLSSKSLENAAAPKLHDEKDKARAATAKAASARLSAPRYYPATTRATREAPQRTRESPGMQDGIRVPSR